MLEISLTNNPLAKCKLIYCDYQSIPKEGDGKSAWVVEGEI
jgi:hypothetical protein